MAAGDPIRLGSASGLALIPMSNSRIQTNDYGVQYGTVTYQLGDQSSSQSVRLTLGSLYNGTLPQFNSFLVNRSGDITGGDGTTATIDVEYVKQDPKWVNIPLDSADLELKQFKLADFSGFGTLYDSLYTVVIPILHPTVNYRYSSLTAKTDLGTYGTPPGAPRLTDQIFHYSIYAFDSTQIDIEQKIINGTGTTYTIQTNGTCTRGTVNTTSTVTGIFGTSQYMTINPVDLHFQPDPKGWLCIKQDQKPLAAGGIYEIDEQWKTQYIFSGTTPGDWWQGAHQLHCT